MKSRRVDCQESAWGFARKRNRDLRGGTIPTNELPCSSWATEKNNNPPQPDRAPSIFLRRLFQNMAVIKAPGGLYFIPTVFFLFLALVFSWPFSVKSENEMGTRMGKLPPPVVQSTVDGAQYREKTVEFKWRRVEGASKYHIQVAEDRDFTFLQDDRKDIRGKAYIFYSLDFKTYFFRVSAIDEDGMKGNGPIRCNLS